MKSKSELFDAVVAAEDLLGAPRRGKPVVVNGKPAVLKGKSRAIVDIAYNVDEIVVEFFDDVGESIDVAVIPETYMSLKTAEGDEKDKTARPEDRR